ncbi:hypothetical protein INT47_012514 [Mucor saturninus]|uniref:F-box domain-containing protein n=1 Tax=Mucor saturninus TaxID=64648 RepID=A0A8H7QP96_9FUNG|nr:hypothetical protein INT47_012514 [Mucor saturninus]
MSASNVPAELLIATFRLLERKALRECMFVCKTWHSLITPLYFEEIPLHAGTILLVKQLLGLPRKHHKEHFQHGHWVKKLSIQFDNFSSYKTMIPGQDSAKRSFKLRPKEFATLLSYLPNLRVLDATSSHYFNYYMECLADSNQRIQRLEQIPCDMHENSFLPNLAACYNYRQSLTRLKTVYNASSLFSYTYQSEDDTFISLLSAFKHLTHLDLYNETLHSRLSPFHILGICPNLVRLKYHTKEYLLDNDLVRSNLSRSKLKQLDITAPSLSPAYINYITTHMPKDMENVSIQLKSIDFCNWILQLGVRTADKLARFLSKVKHVRIVCSVSQQQYKRDSNGLKMTLFYRFLGILRAGRNMYCTGAYDDFDPNETEIKASGHRLEFRYGLDHEDFTLNEGADVDRCVSVFTPDLGKSSIGPEIINHLAFTMRRQEDEDSLYQALKYALTQCPHLCRFELENNTRQMFGGAALKPTRFNPRESKHDMLKVFRVVGGGLSNEMVGLLRNYLPGVQEIVTEFGDEDGSDWTEKSGELNVTSLSSLNSLTLDTRTMLYNDSTLNNLSIHLEYNGDDTYYTIQKQLTEMNAYTLVRTETKPSNPFSIKCNSIPNIRFSIDNDRFFDFEEGQIIRPETSIKYWGSFLQSTATHFC